MNANSGLQILFLVNAGLVGPYVAHGGPTIRGFAVVSVQIDAVRIDLSTRYGLAG